MFRNLALIDDPTLNRLAAFITILVGAGQMAYWSRDIIRWYKAKNTEFKINFATLVAGLEFVFAVGLFCFGIVWLYPRLFGEPFWQLGLRLLYCIALLWICSTILKVLLTVTGKYWLFPLNRQLLDEYFGADDDPVAPGKVESNGAPDE